MGFASAPIVVLTEMFADLQFWRLQLKELPLGPKKKWWHESFLLDLEEVDVFLWKLMFFLWKLVFFIEVDVFYMFSHFGVVVVQKKNQSMWG